MKSDDQITVRHKRTIQRQSYWSAIFFIKSNFKNKFEKNTCTMHYESRIKRLCKLCTYGEHTLFYLVKVVQ